MTIPDPRSKAGITLTMELVLCISLGLLAAMLILVLHSDGNLDHLRNTGTLYRSIWVAVVIGGIGGIVVGIIFGVMSRHKPVGLRLSRVVFIGIPALMAALDLMIYVLLDSVVPTNVARLMLAVFAAIIPAALFYLFLSSRRTPLLNSFLRDLNRLNVVESQPNLLDGYLERFQSVFGHISPDRLSTIKTQLRSKSNESVEPVDFDLPISALLPITLLTFACAGGWLLAMLPMDQTRTAFPLTPIRHPSIYALLGSYAFTLHFLLWRYFSNDLTPNAYLSALRRGLLGLIVGWVLTEAALPVLITLSAPDLFPANAPVRTENLLLVAGFFAGTFPSIAWDAIFSTVFSRLPNLGDIPKFARQAPLHLLEGMNVWHETRLEEEDILSVQNMAHADLIHLIIHTRFETQRLVDWIDQAILLSVLASQSPALFIQKREFLRHYGIRGASHLEKIQKLDIVEGSVAFGDVKIEARKWLQALSVAVTLNPNFVLVTNYLAATSAK